MQTENKDEISNGDLGEVLDIYRKDKKMAMRVDFGDDRVVEFTDDDYWPLTLGYAMSVHKSQGNECPVVVISNFSLRLKQVYRSMQELYKKTA